MFPQKPGSIEQSEISKRYVSLVKMGVHFPSKPTYYNYISEKRMLAEKKNKSQMGNSEISQMPRTTIAPSVDLKSKSKNNIELSEEIVSNKEGQKNVSKPKPVPVDPPKKESVP